MAAKLPGVDVHPEYARGRADGSREAFGLVAGALRKRAAAWLAQEAGRGRIAAAFLWQLTELWSSRVEGFAAELEQRAAAAVPVEAPAPKRRWFR